jgi:hypothetical protein
MERKRHALGVLFVHGIGEQPRGDTLLAFGEPLIQSLQGWMAGREIGSAAVIESKLSTSDLESDQPAHAILEMRVGDRPAHTWLLAESWWADEFRRPRFMNLAGWLLTIGPWAIISHASRRLRDAPKLQRPYQLLKIVLAVPLSLLMQFVVASVAVLAWLPIPVLRRMISGFLLTITGTLGDSYVLLENPVQKAAAIGALRRNVAWLAERCDKIAVVAHSQGAAIARLMLAEHRHPRVCLLATFGSGVAKLAELESLSTGRRARAVRTMLAVSLLTIALLPRALALVKDDDVRSIVWTWFLVVPLVVIGVAVVFVWNEVKHWPQRAAKLSLRPLDWVDYCATSDPVPNGPLAPRGVVERLKSITVTNRMSWLTDHSAYWENRDEFVLPLACRLDRCAGTRIFPGKRLEPVATVPARRTRVAVLATTRAVIALLVAPIMMTALRDQLSVFGRDVLLRSLADRPLTKPISELLTGLGSFVGLVVGPLLGGDTAWLEQLGYAAVGALIPLATIAAWYRFCVLPMWESWDRQCFQWLCRPGQIPKARADRLVQPVLVAAIAFVPLALSVRALFQPDVRLLLGEGVNTIITVPFTLIALVMVAAAIALIVQVPVAAVRGILDFLKKRASRANETPSDQAHV